MTMKQAGTLSRASAIGTLTTLASFGLDFLAKRTDNPVLKKGCQGLAMAAGCTGHVCHGATIIGLVCSGGVFSGVGLMGGALGVSVWAASTILTNLWPSQDGK